MNDKEIYKVFSSLETPEQAERFLSDILTDKELEEVKSRWVLIKALYEGKTQREARDLTGVSIATVTRGAKVLKSGKGGFEEMLESSSFYGNVNQDLDRIRSEVDKIDHKIIELLGERMNLMPFIAQFKRDQKMRLTQKEREEKSLDEKKRKARKYGIDSELIDLIFTNIFKEAKKIQIPSLLSHSVEDLKKLQKSHKGYKVPVTLTIKTDTETPISIYQRVTKDKPYSFILESVGNDNEFSRYSFIGTNPRKIITVDNGFSAVMDLKTGQIENSKVDSPIDVLRKEVKGQKIVKSDNLPRFLGGALGFLTYDCIRYFEKSIKLQREKSQDIPEALYGIYDELAVFDHKEKTVSFLHLFDLDDNLEQKYAEMVVGFMDKLATLEKHLKLEPLSTNIDKGEIEIESDTKKEDFLKTVQQAKEDIKNGEVFQIIISQEFKVKTSAESLDLYRSLRQVNPSAYLFYFKTPDFSIIGASPETFVKVEDGKISMKALAGTTLRGENYEDDKKREKELLENEKERAEHMMLVDLARNDVGKFSKFGTVKVEDLMHISRSSYVMHIASLITGELNSKFDALDVLKACFPRGTLSGAPKVRAMELITKYEPKKRSIYGGALHYYDYSGNLDAAIMIRTMLKKDDYVYVRAGAGVVFDSCPEGEYKETQNKAKGVIKAISQARQFTLNG